MGHDQKCNIDNRLLYCALSSQLKCGYIYNYIYIYIYYNYI